MTTITSSPLKPYLKPPSSIYAIHAKNGTSFRGSVSIYEGGRERGMESSIPKFGRSLKVPFVQELAKENLAGVPSRYIRHDNNRLIPPETLPETPTVDLHKLFDADSMDSELLNLHNACKKWGFFQLINHGVESAVMERMKLEAVGFFDLPMEEKLKLRQEEDDVEGYGQAFVVSEEQKLDWGDIFYVVTLPTSMRKPHLIPKLPSKFRDAMEAYSAEVKVVAMKILKQMSKALGMKAEEMETVFEGGMQSIRMNYYPPCPQPELVAGLSPHSDGVGLGIVLQANEIDGFHVKKDGIWVPISPLPNAFIIVVGDMLEIVTNGMYNSVEHKADVDASEKRVTIATFLFPNLDGDFGPAPSMVTPETPPKFKKITVADYLRGYLSKELDGKSSFLDTIRI